LLTTKQNLLEYITKRAKLLENKNKKNIIKLYKTQSNSSKNYLKLQNKREIQLQKY